MKLRYFSALAMLPLIFASCVINNGLDKMTDVQKLLTISMINSEPYTTAPLTDPNLPTEISDFFQYTPNAVLTNFDLLTNEKEYIVISAEILAQDPIYVVKTTGNPRNLNKFYGKAPAEDPVSGRHKIIAELYLTKKTLGFEAPLVVYLPSLGSKSTILERTIGAYLAKNGFSTLMVYPDMLPSSPDQLMVDLNNFFVRNTLSIRQTLSLVIDKMNKYFPIITLHEVIPKLDPNQIYAMGVSLGAIRMPYFIASEPRVKKGAIIMGGGGLPDLLTESEETSVIAYRNYQYKNNRFVPGKEAFRAVIKQFWFMDPLELVSYIHPNRISQAITIGDNVVPTSLQYMLHGNIGKNLPSPIGTSDLKTYNFNYYGKPLLSGVVEAYELTNGGHPPPEGHFDLATQLKDVLNFVRDGINRKRVDPNS